MRSLSWFSARLPIAHQNLTVLHRLFECPLPVGAACPCRFRQRVCSFATDSAHVDSTPVYVVTATVRTEKQSLWIQLSTAPCHPPNERGAFANGAPPLREMVLAAIDGLRRRPLELH